MKYHIVFRKWIKWKFLIIELYLLKYKLIPTIYLEVGDKNLANITYVPCIIQKLFDLVFSRNIDKNAFCNRNRIREQKINIILVIQISKNMNLNFL